MNKYTNLHKIRKDNKVLIAGGSGLVGTRLSEMLLDKGYNIAILSRDKNNSTKNYYHWDVANKTIEEGAVENADFIINLSGAGIADKRWTKARKKVIVESRTQTTDLLYKTVQNSKTKIKAFISSSAVGYYGAITSDKIFNEDDLPSDDFLAKTCIDWEKACWNFNNLNCRTVALRTGVVLTQKGGALEKIIKPIKMNFGSAIGNGKQYVPWIHIDDLCDMYIRAIEDSQMTGAYNAVAPDYVTYKGFAKISAHILNKPFFFPNVPKFVLKLTLGELAVLLLEGSRISANKVLKTGFQFKYPAINEALKNLLTN